MTATLFDFNGVLVDDEHVHLAAFREVLGFPIPDEAYAERYMGFDDAGAFRAMLRDAGREREANDDAEVARLVAAKKPVYMRRIASDLVIFEGAREIVERRASHGVVGIVSGALRDEIEHALGVMGVRDRVRFIVSAEDAPACKPDPQGYLLARRMLGGAAAVVIEDSLAGVAAAKAAGLRCAAVAHSYAAERLREAGADVVATRLAELTDAMLDA